MSRVSRQAKILNIINDLDIETQEELVEQLRISAFVVTQATISRDIKELNLIKTLSASGKYRYSALHDANTTLSSKVLNLFKETVITVRVALNQIVIKTMTGCAATVGSVVEQMKIGQILGIVCGTDTLLLICLDQANANLVAQQLDCLLTDR